MRTRMILISIAGAALVGCNPYVAAVSVVSQTYGVATDERSISTQAADADIEAQVKAALIQSPVQGTGGLRVYSRRGVVLLCGVVPPGSAAGRAAVQIARGIAGVKRVETFFVASEPSETADIEIEAKVKAAFVADPNLSADQVTVNVFGGHVVLVGIVNTPDQIDEFVSDARSVSGVVSVRSYIQLAG